MTECHFSITRVHRVHCVWYTVHCTVQCALEFSEAVPSQQISMKKVCSNNVLWETTVFPLDVDSYLIDRSWKHLNLPLSADGEDVG